jgi:hypothetical protein
LVKHLLATDLSKRFGNLKNGNFFLTKEWTILKTIDILLEWFSATLRTNKSSLHSFQQSKVMMIHLTIAKWMTQTRQQCQYQQNRIHFYNGNEFVFLHHRKKMFSILYFKYFHFFYKAELNNTISHIYLLLSKYALYFKYLYKLNFITNIIIS